MLGLSPGCAASRLRISAIICAWVSLRSSSGSAWHEEVDVRDEPPPPLTPIDGSICATPSMPLHLLQQLERHLAGALERRALRRVDVDRPLAHVLVRHELAADHPVQRERQQRTSTTDTPMITPE